ncbi:TRAP transporter substrate-binding protein DctP [Salipiger thiooxidans]|uniref:TRAP transporter substrate-binding protein DctP n=1 Tax=Salipiger thiooxidans TaxID=282683 RepID=UPI001CD7CD9E|nr:TRAP transporter substrate-binding protein DctP [Salipiger thiooxidans]MCA0849777.1 TRAP transporter substrate-binding protein DctP [Salipiger thiooxidans]
MDQAVPSGIVDIGVGSASILAGTIPALDIFGVPFYFDTREKLNKAVAVGTPIRDTLDAEIEKTGLNAVFWIPYGSIAMAMRDEPVRTPDEMSGKKIRSFSAVSSQFSEAVGAAPVVTSGGEQFLALQRGLVEGGLTGWSSFTGRRLYDVAKYAVATDHSYETHFALMKQSTWDSLSPEQQQIFEEVGKSLETELLDEVFSVVGEVKAELEGKMEVIELTPEEKMKWKEAKAPIAAQFTDGAGPVSLAVFDEAEEIQ